MAAEAARYQLESTMTETGAPHHFTRATQKRSGWGDRVVTLVKWGPADSIPESIVAVECAMPSTGFTL